MMINIKRLFFVSAFIAVFFIATNSSAQEINQFDSNKKRTGVWKKYYSNKRIRYIGEFKNGKEIGTFKFYDITTSDYPVATKRFYNDSDSVEVKHFFLDGKLNSLGMMYGKDRVGKWVYYYKDGKILSEEFYVDGKLSGNVKIFYKNGKLTENTEYKNGLKHGVSKKYTDKEVLIEELTFVNGKANGIAKYYEVNGSLKEKGVYEDGKRVGKWEFYIEGEIVSDKEKKATKTLKKSN